MSSIRRHTLALTSVAVLVVSLAPLRAYAGPHMETSPTVKRGEYLSTILGCGDCHTPGTFYGAPDMSRRLSGSELGWQGPWGVSYARNLTPDKETGLGGWTDEQIVKAIRQGIRPDGRALLPPMPWPDFVGLHDDDVHAIVAYLKSIPPVHHAAPAIIPPGAPVTGAVITFPPPPAWDAPKGPPPGASAPAPTATPAK